MIVTTKSPRSIGRLTRVCLVLALALAPAGLLTPAPSAAAGRVEVQVLSAPKPDKVSGGDVLLGIGLPAGAKTEELTVTAGRRDVTKAFQASQGRLIGLVDKLPEGRTLIRARLGGRSGQVMVTNHPGQGPMFSGPQQRPFICQTESYISPLGNRLPPATDANCSAPTTVEYGYRAQGSAQLIKVPDPTQVPANVEMITIADGRTVPYMVRI
ncbi:MAG: DUF6351 family protein, partial [Propionibacteriales bacterium]|nr:DUF6351 family protein [Propionibacteriales bacterium]